MSVIRKKIYKGVPSPVIKIGKSGNTISANRTNGETNEVPAIAVKPVPLVNYRRGGVLGKIKIERNDKKWSNMILLL